MKAMISLLGPPRSPVSCISHWEATVKADGYCICLEVVAQDNALKMTGTAIDRRPDVARPLWQRGPDCA